MRIVLVWHEREASCKARRIACRRIAPAHEPRMSRRRLTLAAVAAVVVFAGGTQIAAASVAVRQGGRPLIGQTFDAGFLDRAMR
jgi:hypothetical protein